MARHPAPDLTHLPIALYVRLSKNPDGTRDSTAYQIKTGTQLLESKFPERPILVFADDDESASDEDHHRPAFEEMMKAIRRKQVGAVAAKMQSRIARNKLHWEQFKIACRHTGIRHLITFANTTYGEVNLAEGQSLAGDIVNLVDANYAEVTRLNVLGTLEYRATEGLPPGGRHFGYLNVDKTLVPDPVTGPEVPLMASRLLSGWTLADVVRDLNDREVPTARGGTWAPATVVGILKGGIVAGVVIRHEQVLRVGTWESLLDRETWDAVRSLLSRRRVITRNGKPMAIGGRRRFPVRKFLLTGGIAICGKCQAPLKAQRRQDSRLPIYKCVVKGCGGIACVAQPLEDWVSSEFRRVAMMPWFRARLTVDDPYADTRAALRQEEVILEARLTEAGSAFGRGEINVTALAGVQAHVDVRRAEIATALAAMPEPVGLEGFDLDAIVAAWDDLHLNEQHTILLRVQCQAVVGPATPGLKSFDSGRVALTFFGQ